MLSILSAAYYVAWEPNMIFPYVCSTDHSQTLLTQKRWSQSRVITSAPSIHPSAHLLLSVSRDGYGKWGKRCTLNLIKNKFNNVHVILSLRVILSLVEVTSVHTGAIEISFCVCVCECANKRIIQLCIITIFHKHTVIYHNKYVNTGISIIIYVHVYYGR